METNSRTGLCSLHLEKMKNVLVINKKSGQQKSP